MNYYLQHEDIFIDENNNVIPDVNDICEWYMFDNKCKKYNLKFTDSPASKYIQKMYDSIHDYTVLGIDNTTAHTIGNVALNVFRIITKDIIKHAYIPVVSSKGFAGYIHLITNDDVIIDTAYTSDKFKKTDDTLEYYRLKLGLLYYLLDSYKEFGYLMHISTNNGIKRQYIDGVYDKTRCENIINAYLSQKNVPKHTNIGKADILLYKIYNAQKRLELPLN